MDPHLSLRRALDAFDAREFVRKHRGHKESPSTLAHEWLLPCPRPKCGSSRLRWNNKKHTFICWGCRMTGDTLYLIQVMERVDAEGAIDYVVDGYVGGDADLRLSPVLTEAIHKPVRVTALPPIQWPLWVDRLTTPSPMHEPAWAYIRKRGITSEQVSAYRIGFGRHGPLTNYILFPVFMDGQLVYWQGRATWDPPAHLTPAQRKQWSAETGYKKTLNPVSLPGQATASEILYGFDAAKHYTHIVICEGPVDAVKVGPHAVALLGKAPSPAKIARLMKTRARRFTVYLDRGTEERRVAEELASSLAVFGDVFIATPPPGKDAGALTIAENTSIVSAAERWEPLRLSPDLQR